MQSVVVRLALGGTLVIQSRRVVQFYGTDSTQTYVAMAMGTTPLLHDAGSAGLPPCDLP